MTVWKIVGVAKALKDKTRKDYYDPDDKKKKKSISRKKEHSTGRGERYLSQRDVSKK